MMGAKLEGVEQLERGVKDWLRKLGDKAEKGLKLAAIHVRNEAIPFIPQETGIMVETLLSKLKPERGGGLTSRGLVTVGTHYALQVHEDYIKLHGAAFNAFYAADIAAGRINSFSGLKMKLKKDTEQDHFLSTPLFQESDVVAGIITKALLDK